MSLLNGIASTNVERDNTAVFKPTGVMEFPRVWVSAAGVQKEMGRTALTGASYRHFDQCTTNPPTTMRRVHRHIVNPSSQSS
jgi:hypothetical protein